MANQQLKSHFEATNAYLDRQDKAIDGIKDDIAYLNEKFEALQNTPGEWTPEEKVIADAIDARLNKTTDAIESLDSQGTRPTPPNV